MLINRKEVQAIIMAVQASLTDELREKQWRGHENPMAGHCYVASEAFLHLVGGKSAGWKPMFTRHYDQPHWFLQHNIGGRVDITASQFDEPVKYHVARGKGFLTKQPSKRAQIVIDRALVLLKQSDLCIDGWYNG